MTEIAYEDGPGGLAQWDQQHAEALNSLRKAHGFVLLTFPDLEGAPATLHVCAKGGGIYAISDLLCRALDSTQEMAEDFAAWLASYKDAET